MLTMRPLDSALWLCLCAVLLAVGTLPQVAGEFLRKEDAGRAWAHVNLNRAAAADLMALPGMTFRKAHALVKARETRGSFKSADEVAAVPGFTRNYVYRIQDSIDVGE